MAEPLSTRLARGTDRLVAFLLLGVVLVLAAAARVSEPSASPVVVAEDPLTHIVFTKEHVARGYFADSFHLQTTLYPPGLHAYVGSLVMLTGLDLYELAIWLPVAWSLLAIAVAFLFGWRFAGAAGGFVAALLLAVLPEVVFRSFLFSPTVLDLVFLPLFAWTLSEAQEGRLPALAGTGVAGAALALAHPWMLSIAVAVGATVLVLQHQLPRVLERAEGRAAPDAASAWCAGTLAGLAAFAYLASLAHDVDKGVAGANALLAAGALALGGLFALEARGIVRWPRFGTLVRRRWVALAAGAVVAAILAQGVLLLTRGTLPTNVDYAIMLGPVAPVAAFAGIATVFVSRNAFGLWGFALVVLLFPFTAADLLNLWYLPHRTVVFLAVGIAFLGGAAAQTLVDAAHTFVATRSPHAGRWAPVGATVLVALVVAPQVTAATPGPYEWYRLFNAEEFEGLQYAAERTHESPIDRVLSASWQANAFTKAMGEMSRVDYDPGYFQSEARRAEWNSWSSPGHLYVVADANATRQYGDPFDGHPSYSVAWDCSCGTLTVYRWEG